MICSIKDKLIYLMDFKIIEYNEDEKINNISVSEK